MTTDDAAIATTWRCRMFIKRKETDERHCGGENPPVSPPAEEKQNTPAPYDQGEGAPACQTDNAVTTSADRQPQVDLKPLIAVLEDIGRNLGELRSRLDNQADIVRTVANQSDTLRLMAERLRALEENSIREHVLLPILRDLLLLYDAVVNAQAKLQQEQTNHDIAASVLTSLVSDVLDCLSRYEVTLMADTTQTFNPKSQRVVGVRYSDKVPVGAVVEVVRRGFYLTNKVMRSEEVIVNTK